MALSIYAYIECILYVFSMVITQIQETFAKTWPDLLMGGFLKKRYRCMLTGYCFSFVYVIFRFGTI